MNEHSLDKDMGQQPTSQVLQGSSSAAGTSEVRAENLEIVKASTGAVDVQRTATTKMWSQGTPDVRMHSGGLL